jgi:hypothetical protein
MNKGELSDKLFELRAQKDELNNQLSDINKEIDQVEYYLIQAMEEDGLDQLRSGKGLISKKVELYPQVEDLDGLVKWAYENGKPEILQRRVSKGVFDEIFQQSGEYPDGVKTYEKKTLNYRKSR